MQEVKEVNLNNRPQSSNYYRGLIYTRIEDRGPDVLVNLTNLDESQALALSVQSFTIIGVGTGSRSSGSWVGHLFGPMPVPTGQLMNSLIFPFVIDDKNSKDLRVVKSGRSCAFIILVSRQMALYDEFRTEVQEFLNKWIETNAITPENIKLLSKWIENQNSVHIQEKKEDISLTDDSTELQKTIRNQSNKIALLQHLTGLDSLSNALVTLYETHPGGGTVDQLAKLAGMSKFMLNWNLRKYVKAGILQIEDNNIYFLK